MFVLILPEPFLRPSISVLSVDFQFLHPLTTVSYDFYVPTINRGLSLINW